MRKQNQNQRRTAKLHIESRTEMNRSKTRTSARFRIIRANGKVEKHILIFDPAELHSLKVAVFTELHPGDRLEHEDCDLPDLTAHT